MKKLLFIVLLACSLNTKAQLIDSAHGLGVAGYLTGGFNLPRLHSPTRKDTIPVIMLTCDTLHYTNYTPSISIKNYFDKAGTILWLKGYAARTQSMICCGGAYGESYVWMTGNTEYLDANKQPLNKNVIVWLTKQTN